MLRKKNVAIVLVGVLTLGSAPLAQRTGAHTWDSVSPIDEGRAPVVLEGFVLAPDGTPASGSRIVTSAGGEATVDAEGHYRLEIRVPPEVDSVQVTALGGRAGGPTTSVAVGVPRAAGSLRVEPLVLAGGCSPSWLPTFGQRESTDPFKSVYDLTFLDDGSGPAMFACGDFEFLGSQEVSYVARRDGLYWSALGSRLNARAFAMQAFDDGHGPALYVGGDFTVAGGLPASHIARWDGSSWSTLGAGLSLAVSSLAVYDDGSGPALYAGEAPPYAAGQLFHVARWNGSSWVVIGTFYSLKPGSISAMAEYDLGDGPALYVAGEFTEVNGVPASRIARWDGSSWSTLGAGTSLRIACMAVFDDGSGPSLYVGGSFSAGGAQDIARWNGSSWVPLGPLHSTRFNGSVLDLKVFDDGSGSALYAAGTFTTTGSVSVGRIARWNGTAWSAPGIGMANGNVNALEVHDDGAGPALHAAGSFRKADGKIARYFANWDGSSWSALASGLDWQVEALEVHDDGGGPALYAGGAFEVANGEAASRIARWDGENWGALASGLSGGDVHALTVFDHGSGGELYAGGSFTDAGGAPAAKVARWDGASWSPLASGLSGGDVRALIVFDDGSGSALFAGGGFTAAGGVPAAKIARWDGSSWSPLAGGVAGGDVRALAVYDDGSGPALFVGGAFTDAGGAPAARIARWDGASWSPLASGLDSAGEGVLALAVFDDGNGPALYAGGDFTAAGGVAASKLARWNGSSWSPVGTLGGSDPVVYSLWAHDDGGGSALYVGGLFTSAGGVAATNIARWNGSDWSALGIGQSDRVTCFATYDDGRGPTLCAGGWFWRPAKDCFVARWGCIEALPPVLSTPDFVSVLDRPGNGAGEVVSFTVTATDDFDPFPGVVCSPPSGSLFPPGTTLVTCTATDASGKESMRQFPVHVLDQAHDARRR